jgi:hypothetical protein
MVLGQAIMVASDRRLIFCGLASDPALGQMLIEAYRSWTLEQTNDPVYSVFLPRFELRASQHQPARLLFCYFLSLSLSLSWFSYFLQSILFSDHHRRSPIG